MKHCVAILFVSVVLAANLSAAEVLLEQVISHESPLFRCRQARMGVGRDGFVYLTDDQGGKGFCLRLSRDGRQKLGSEVVYAIFNATANANGVIATANAHFNHSLNIYDSGFQKLVAADDFLVNDQVGWDAPLHVEAGASGDFYGIDQHRNRVVRVGPDGKVKAVYPIRATHEADWGKPNDFRVSEALQSFYWLTNGHVVRTRLDGSTVWKAAVAVQYRWDVGSHGGWDIDDRGNVYLLEGAGVALKRLDADGKPLASIPLEMGDYKPTAAAHIGGLRIVDSDAVVRRVSATELFQVYDLKSGQQKHVASIDHESLSVRFPSLTWINGEKIPVAIQFQSSSQGPGPHFRVWMTPFGVSDWHEIPRDGDSNITVPDDYAGLYQLKISPEVLPQQAKEPAEYLVREIVEVRRPGSKGTVAVVTPLNRLHYAANESIRGRVIGRMTAAIEDRIEIRLRDLHSREVVASKSIRLVKAAESAGELRGDFVFAPDNGSVAKPGDYQLDVDVPGLTCVSQRIVIGGGKTDSDFRKILYGDYGLTSPQGNAWEAPDFAKAHTNRMQKLGINQFVNRTQQLSLDFANDENGRGLLNRVKQRLQADPLAVTPEKAEFGAPHHAMAGIYSANGWREFLILLYMDSGLPLGTGFDRRTPAQFAEAIDKYTESFWSYSGFQGWAWVANWWLFDLNAKFTSADERKAYEAALKSASTGAWDPILDKVDDRKFAFAVDAQASFRKALDVADRRIAERQGLAPRRLSTATAGPYRRPEVLPEFNFSNVDEIDVHYQAEQITTPDWVPHGVDVSKREGQPCWIHPELWNDFGTGEQILPASWLAITRGADGIGSAGTIPNWLGVNMDSRLGFHGTVSVFRSVHRAIDELAEPMNRIRLSRRPWSDSDRIGIVVSPRQIKIETFGGGLGSTTFSRQFEAYQSLLTANCSARFVSLEEVKHRFLAETKENLPLAQCFDALLLVGQTVELEPQWQSFLKQAKVAGVKIFADGTSRKEICPEAQTLGLSFDGIEKEHSVNSDFAHYVYPARFRANVRALASVVQEIKSRSQRPREVASLSVTEDKFGNEQPVVILQEHPAEDGSRIVSVINNTPTPLPPGQLRKLGRAISTRSPVVARLKFDLATDQKVVDLVSHKEIGAEVSADLRDSFARFYWVGPKISSPFTEQRADDKARQPASALLFGPHLRDVAVSPDGATAVLNAFNWDHNLYGLDLATGKVRFRKRIADHFSYAPAATAAGFFVQGYDLNSAEGYHLYAVNSDGNSTRRFALPGVPGCLTGWAFTAWIQDRINNFAVPTFGAWVAASGNLGLAVWDRDGKQLWAEDWSQSERKSYQLQALGAETLLVAHGMKVMARRAASGQELWSLTLANSGEIIGLHASQDGSMLAVRTTNAGGRVFLVRDGRVIGQFTTSADGLSLSANGSVIAVTTGHQLKVFGDRGLMWLAQGDDQMRFPCVSADGKRIAACSEIGTLSVFSNEGQLLHQRDEGCIVVPSWLTGDDLLIAGWTGSVARITPAFDDRWRTHVRDTEVLALATEISTGDRSPDPPTSRVTSWAVAQPVSPDRKNLLEPNRFIAHWKMGDQLVAPVNSINDLVDAKMSSSTEQSNAKVKPWLSWYDHGMIESGWRGEFSLVADSFNRQLRIDAITFVEDAAHPESWLRDMRCEFWDADAERWVFAQYLTSDSAVHSHRLQKPIEAARIRFIKSDGHAWPAGNVRLQELMLHGDVLGASHPDVVARRPVAILFDENVASVKSSYEHGHNAGLKFATGPDAFSGGNYITVPADKNYGALWQPPFGHMTPNWWFEVVEKPEPGQYRYLQFSVKALAPETKGITLRLAPSHHGGVAVTLGQPTPCEGAVMYQESASVPLQWHTVTIDLWKQLPENQRGKPLNIGAMSLGTVGGPAAIDRIRLGRTAEDLQGK